MWKVQRTDDGDSIVLLVSGRIEGEHLADLREVFTAEAGGQNFILDMGEVRLVRNCPAYIREWIQRERGK
jgi:hypothetical protein